MLQFCNFINKKKIEKMVSFSGSDPVLAPVILPARTSNLVLLPRHKAFSSTLLSPFAQFIN